MTDIMETGCTELVGWQAPYLTLGEGMRHYVQEHILAEGRDPYRLVTVAAHAFRVLGPEIDITKIDRAKVRMYTATRQSEGVCGATVRRELSLIQAAAHHNLREERIKTAPKFVKPKPSEPRCRWLTRDEYRRLMAQPMPYRIRLFLLMAFGTGARSEAIEEATWDRVNWTSRTIDFRVPGVIYRNKRRVVAPIGDVLYHRLEAAYARPNRSDYVIGLSPRGKPCTTYRFVKDLMRSIGIDEVGVARHVARHTFCSWLIQAGVSYAKVGALVGDTAAMVEKVYSHLAPAHTREAVNLALVA